MAANDRSQSNPSVNDASRQSAADASARQTSTTTGSPGGATTSSSSGRGAASGDRNVEQERSIRTDRENGGTSRGVSRHPENQANEGWSSRPFTPFTMMSRMAEDMDRLFEAFGFGSPSFAVSPRPRSSFDQGLAANDAFSLERGAWSPQLETFRRGDKLVVRADLPGLTKDDVRVEVEDGMLTISGERSDEHEENRDDFYRSERTYGEFYRAIPLPEGVNGDACEATFKDGVLEVTLPAPKSSSKRQIEIR